MAMGIVSDKEFDLESQKIVNTPVSKREESNSVSNTIPSAVVVDNPAKGRGHNPEVPNSLRNLIGETATTGGRQEAIKLAESFGISRSSASAYANGAVSTSTYDDRPNAPVINRVKAGIAKKARGRLVAALRNITDDKLIATKARDLAGIAKDMSAVVRSMEETDNPLAPKGGNGPTFVFYSPQFRKEEVFDVIHAKE